MYMLVLSGGHFVSEIAAPHLFLLLNVVKLNC